MLVASVISILIAYLSRWYFEELFLRMKGGVFARRVISGYPHTPEVRRSTELTSIKLETENPETTSRN
jgi:hypothetical protein